MKRRFILSVLALMLAASVARGERYLYGGVNYTTALLPRWLQDGWSGDMGFAAGFEQPVTPDLRVVLDYNRSRFVPDPRHFSEGGRRLLISGQATADLFTLGLKAQLPKKSRRVLTPFVTASAGYSTLKVRSMDAVDIFDGSLREYPGSILEGPTIKAGGGLMIIGPVGSFLDVQFDLYGTWLIGDDPVSNGYGRMLVLVRLP